MPCHVHLNDLEGFNNILKRSMPDTEDCYFITKDNGTIQGNPIVMIHFESKLPGRGKTSFGTSQKVLTVEEFLRVAEGLRVRYGDMRERTSFPKEGDESVVEKEFKGLKWSAMLKEKVYLVAIEGGNNLSIAGDLEEAQKIAEYLINRSLMDERMKDEGN